MTENKGNAYRMKQVWSTFFVIIALAVAIALYWGADTSALVAVGAAVLIIGIAIAGVGATHDRTPDKFVPSEMIYRVVAGLFVILIGITMIVVEYSEAWVAAVVFIVGIALIGLLAALNNSKHSKY